MSHLTAVILSGWSPFPGNINQLVIKLSSYVDQLSASGGIISEFVNPKYKDASKTAFKSSTRLECMMQDYPKALPPTAKVGFTVVNQVCAQPLLLCVCLGGEGGRGALVAQLPVALL